MKKFFLLMISAIFILSNARFAQAEKIVILYTGETHSDLYTCHCPIEPFGGLARRMTKIKELRKTYPNLLLVDSGGFFAGGRLDEYSLNEDLNKERTQFNLRALKLMGYDALAIGDEEFNFGVDFLVNEIAKTKLNFISCNVKVKGSLDYLVKKIGAVKIGIVAVTPPEPTGLPLQIAEPINSIKSTVENLRNKEKVDVVILLSHLGEARDMQLLQDLNGIDFVISGHSIYGRDKDTGIGNAVLLRPAWQGRKLGKLEIEIDKGKIKGYAVDLIGLGQDILDAPEIKQFLPVCFADKDCWKPGLKGQCENGATKGAKCNFGEYAKIPLLVVQTKDCRTCNSQPFLSFMKGQFPGAEISYLSEEDSLGKRLLQEFNIILLPAYFIGREAEREANFDKFKRFVLLKGDYYFFNPSFSGISYFRDRKFEADKLDLFIILNGPDTSKILQIIKGFLGKNGKLVKFQLHFVAGEDLQKGGFVSPMGLPEIEEDKRTLCVDKYLPQRFWEYLICRSAQVGSTWWEDCLKGSPKQLPAIKECARGQESDELLKDNIKLTADLNIPYGPLFLLNNKEVFGMTPETTIEELERYILGNKRK